MTGPLGSTLTAWARRALSRSEASRYSYRASDRRRRSWQSRVAPKIRRCGRRPASSVWFVGKAELELYYSREVGFPTASHLRLSPNLNFSESTDGHWGTVRVRSCLVGLQPPEGCQQMQPVNRRKRRVRRKIGGLRHGPLGFGLLPKRCAFETERPVDSSTCKMFGIRPAGKCAAVNKNGVASWDGRMLAPRHGFEPRFTAPKAAVLPLDDRGKTRATFPV